MLLSVRAPVGSTNISKEQCCIGRGLAAIRPMDRNMNVMFFIHFFRWVENYLENQGTGTTFKAVSGKQIRELKISLPPLNEQKRIVSKIESIFTQIDASRISLDRIKVLLKQNRQSILKSAFEGKLVPQNPDDEPVEILLKRMHKDSKQELVFEKDVPKRWIKTKLDNLCELIGGGTPSRQNFEYFGEDILWLTPTEIPKNKIVKIYDSREKITTLGLEKSSAKIIPKNSVLLTSRASIGYVAIAGTEVTTNQGFASFVCNTILHSYFLAYWLFGNKNLLESKATGTTFKEISKSKLRELEFKLPPLNEQKRIVSKIESIFGRIDAIENSIILTAHIILRIKLAILLILFTMILYHEFYNTEKNIHRYHNSR